MVSRIELGEGKYTVVNELNEGGGIRALRYGEEWRDLTGDGMVLALCLEIERLQKKLNESEALLSEAHDVMDDVHLYNTDLYYEIILYFNGGDAE